MATSKKPRRVLPSLRIALLSSRSRLRFWILLILSLASLSYLVFKAVRWSAVGVESRAGVGKRGVKYDREREEGRMGFPSLPELVNRDRLWPPNLGEFALSCWGGCADDGVGSRGEAHARCVWRGGRALSERRCCQCKRMKEELQQST